MISLNLISPEQKKSLKTKRAYLLLKNLSSVILILTVLISIILILTYNSLDIEYNLSPNTKNSMDLDEKEIQMINDQLKDIITIQNQSLVWSNILISITSLIPEGIEINSLEIDKTTQLVKISGLAKARNDYLNLISALKNADNLENIQSPIKNLLSKEDINFTLSFTYKFNF
jgi:Tfp pilus assembly protein PilN